MKVKKQLNTLIKGIIYHVFFLTWGLTTSAQVKENSWITPSQNYLKITVSQDGIFEITRNEIQKLGWNLSSINTKNIQLIHRGKEIAIQVSYNNENSLESIFFYGQKNDGSRDSLLYRNAPRANPYHSLYSDTSAYFFVEGTSLGKRIKVETNQFTNLEEEPYHFAEERVVFTEQFSFNNIIGLVPLLQQSYFEYGEGRTGEFIVSDSIANFQFNLKNRPQAIDNKPIITFQVNGRSRITHELASSFGEQDSTYFTVSPFGTYTKQQAVDNRYIQNETINFSLRATKSEPLDWYSMTYIQAVYPQLFLMNEQNVKYFNVNNDSGKASAVFVKDLSENGIIWDVTNPDIPIQLLANSKHEFALANYKNSTKLIVCQNTQKVQGIEALTFNSFDNLKSDYLIITYQGLLESAREYAAYRASEKGGSYNPLVVTSQQLYDAFNYGEESPIALRKFVEHMIDTANPTFLLLIGRGVSFPDELQSNRYPDLVPTIGYPGSDVLFSAGLNGYEEDIQAIPTGRLNVTKNTEVINYLEKVKEVESKESPQLWQKDILHLSGGQSINEIVSLKNVVESVSSKAREGLLGGKVTSLSKQTNQEIEPIDISKEVNAGLGMITFVGHGSANEIDLNIGYCSPPENGFANEGKYPVMFFNGCGVGNIFYRYNAMSTDWLLTPKKGAIAVFANSFWSYAYPTQRYLDVLYEKLFEDPKTVNLTIGEIQQATNVQLNEEGLNEYIKANMHQVILQGDPALRLFPIKKPDFQINNNGVFISSVNQSRPIAENDSINVGLIIQNNGRFEENNQTSVLIKQVYQNNSESSIEMNIDAIAYRDTVYIKIKRDESVNKLLVSLDNRYNIEEYNEGNNEASLDLEDWSDINTRTSFPENILPDLIPPILEVFVDNRLLSNNDFVSKSPLIKLRLSDNQPLDSVSSYHFQVLLKVCEICDYEQVNLTQQPSAAKGTNYAIDIPFENLQKGTYNLLINAKDIAGNQLLIPYEIQFRVTEEELPTTLSVFPNPVKGFVQIQYVIVALTKPTTANVLVYDSKGRLIVEETQVPEIGKNSLFIDTTSFTAGKYFAIVIVNGTEVISAPFVVK